MKRFEIGSSFYLDGQEFKILSGAIHYFRIQPEDWYHSLYNLKALGFNTVETYVPWNMHEPKKGQFDFQGILDIEKFLQIAQDLGLYAIVRPSPFICAEWEFGGMPAWLLTEDMRIRSSDASYLQAVADYYDELLPRLVPRLLRKIYLLQEISDPRQTIILPRCRNSLMSTAKNGHSCVWSFGMVGSIVGKSQLSKGILRNWLKLSMRF